MNWNLREKKEVNGLSRLSLSEIEHQRPNNRRVNACVNFLRTASVLIFLLSCIPQMLNAGAFTIKSMSKLHFSDFLKGLTICTAA